MKKFLLFGALCFLFRPAFGDMISGTTPFSGVAPGVVISSPPVLSIGGSNLITALAAGTTFFLLTADSPVKIIRASVVVIVAGVAGSGDNWTCGTTTGKVVVTTTAAAVAGTVATATGSLSVPAGTVINGWLDTGAATRPIGVLTCGYIPQ